MSEEIKKCDPAAICFGFDRQSDEESLAMFIRCCGQEKLLAKLIPRLSAEEISGTVDFFTGLMNRHLNEGEYHKYFLGRNK